MIRLARSGETARNTKSGAGVGQDFLPRANFEQVEYADSLIQKGAYVIRKDLLVKSIEYKIIRISFSTQAFAFIIMSENPAGENISAGLLIRGDQPIL